MCGEIVLHRYSKQAHVVDTIHTVIPGIMTRNEAAYQRRFSESEINHTNFTQIILQKAHYKYCMNIPVAVFHEYVHYTTKYNVLSTSGNCLHAYGMFQMTHNALTCKTIHK